MEPARQLEELTQGKNAVMQRADKVSFVDIDSTIEYLSKEVNRQATNLQQEIRTKNQDLLASFCRGDITPADLGNKWRDEPRLLKSKDFRHMRQKLQKKYGWSKQSCNTSGSYLPYDDAKMIRLLGCNECSTVCGIDVHCAFPFLCLCHLLWKSYINPDMRWKTQNERVDGARV